MGEPSDAGRAPPSAPAAFLPVEVHHQVTPDVFARLVHARRPAVLANLSLGDCMHKWTLDYLADKLAGQEITIHESDEYELDFLAKNFRYRACNFAQFAARLSTANAQPIYLRSTNSNARAKAPARIEHDFVAIREDLRPADFIPFGDRHQLYHSSVLRIASANVQIWTHFDLYDNVLCQVVGTKRVVLFPPEDAQYLYVAGDKSRVNHLDDWAGCLASFPLVGRASPRQCTLGPGDTLFIPSLWWHNIRSVLPAGQSGAAGHSIGFNIFWRDPELAERSLYADGDVYGNKNPKPFDAALTNLDQALRHLDKLPERYGSFYKQMLLERLKGKLGRP